MTCNHLPTFKETNRRLDLEVFSTDSGKNDGSSTKVMDLALTLTDYALKMIDCSLKLMGVSLTLMDFKRVL